MSAVGSDLLAQAFEARDPLALLPKIGQLGVKRLPGLLHLLHFAQEILLSYLLKSEEANEATLLVSQTANG